MGKGKFPEADNRLFHRMFVCMTCGAKKRADTIKVNAGKINCRKCKQTNLRALKKRK